MTRLRRSWSDRACGSELEKRLLEAVKAAGLPQPLREVPVIPGRRYRFDFCWPADDPTPDYRGVLVEVQGGIWAKGKSGHSSGRGIQRDCEKLNLATLHGWRVLHITAEMIRDGRAIQWLKIALGKEAE